MGDYYFQQQVIAKLNTLLERQAILVSGLEALQANVTALTGIVTQLITDVTNALANDDPDAAVAAASQVVANAVTQLQGLDTTVTGTPPAGGTPAPTPPATGATT
jgi:hypothetical protein